MADHISELIGETPLVLLDALSQETGLRVLAKYEAANPGASIKDRAARSMIDRAEERGEIAPGRTVLVEPTSGNTGVAVAMIAAARGYEVVIAMPESMSRERRALMAAYGARLELTPAAAGMAGAVARAEEIAREVPGAWIVGQFTNPDNPRAHEETTGPEIVRQLGGFPDYVVAGVGTGGTLSGAGAYLKGQNPAIQVVAVEPAGSPVLSEGRAGAHKIQGIGAGFVPETLDTAIYDEVIAIEDEEAFEAGRELAAHDGLLVGISSGAAVAAAAKLARRPENAGKNIVVILPDTGERYLSTSMFDFS